MITKLPPKFSGSSSSCLLHPAKTNYGIDCNRAWLLGIIFREFRTFLKAYAEYGRIGMGIYYITIHIYWIFTFAFVKYIWSIPPLRSFHLKPVLKL